MTKVIGIAVRKGGIAVLKTWTQKVKKLLSKMETVPKSIYLIAF